MHLNVHSIIAQKIKSPLSVLVDSLQSHLSKDVFLSRKFDEFTKYRMSKFNNNIKTWILLFCLHLAESVLQRMPNAVHYLKFNAKSGVCTDVDTDES